MVESCEKRPFFHEPTQRFGKDKDGNFNFCPAQIFGRLNRQIHGSDARPMLEVEASHKLQVEHGDLEDTEPGSLPALRVPNLCAGTPLVTAQQRGNNGREIGLNPGLQIHRPRLNQSWRYPRLPNS